MTTKEKIKINGAVYTPTNLAEFVAQKVMHYYWSEYPNKKSLNITDPACGDGELLLAISNEISRKSEKVKRKLFGYDFDAQAIKKARKRFITNNGSYNISSFHTGNALIPIDGQTSKEGWKSILRDININSGFDILIANPPWGADVTSYKDKLAISGLTLYKGQYDTSDLFIELAFTLLKPGGYFAFIVSDSLFNLERTRLRKLLLESSQIKYIGRFGERIFHRVNRGCAVIICKKNSKHNLCIENDVDCVRLTPTLRKSIINHRISYIDAEKHVIHKVPQQRFTQNNNNNFDIDLESNESDTFNRIRHKEATLGDYLESTRGVELSKKGFVTQCYNCNYWIPFPTSKSPKCIHCKSMLTKSELRRESIVHASEDKNSAPLLVGENIRRYNISNPKWITLGKKGIKYKDATIYHGDKILIRKTGVGIQASIDYSNAYTNQVVYIFKLKDNVNKLVTLEFLLSIINSRLMYFYTVKNHGETEWRSHPYVTQSQILEMPIPNITSTHKETIKEITKHIRPIMRCNKAISVNVDAKVEALVGNIYSINRIDCKVILQTINNSQQLLSVKTLNGLTVEDIYKGKR